MTIISLSCKYDPILDDPNEPPQEEPQNEPLSRSHRRHKPNPWYVGDDWSHSTDPQAHFTTCKVKQSVFNTQYLSSLNWRDTINFLQCNEISTL